jgi:hypothetical protein
VLQKDMRSIWVLQTSFQKILNSEFCLNNFQVRISANFKIQNEVYNPLTLDFNLDFCGFLKGAFVNPIIRGLVGLVRNYSQSLHPCPYKEISNLIHPIISKFHTFFKFQKGDIITIKNLILDTSALPRALPTGHYRIDILVFDGKNKTYLTAHLFCAVKSSNAVKKSKSKKN